ncbi:MAG: hypothetical protein JW384_01929 [Nitrosomonadaceae bacterium]|nr:hypothetical protein [Nitrosomonadaceae bacterium]
MAGRDHKRRQFLQYAAFGMVAAGLPRFVLARN